MFYNRIKGNNENRRSSGETEESGRRCIYAVTRFRTQSQPMQWSGPEVPLNMDIRPNRVCSVKPGDVPSN